MSKVTFVLAYVFYIVFFSWLLISMGYSGVSGLTAPAPSGDWIGGILWFLGLSFSVPAIGIFNTLINLPLTVAFVWCIVELVRGV